MRAKKTAIAIGAAISAAVIIGGCSNQLDDLKGVNPDYPNYSAVYIEPDGFPNIVETCVNGEGFALTTRDYTAILRMPEWDAFCAKQIGKQATVNGQP